MPFFEFNLITPPPNDEFVNEETQLNANWLDLETKLSWLQGINGPIPISNREIGLESRISNRHSVWTGTAWRNPDNIATAWTSWANLTPVGPIIVRSGFPFKWRSNPLIRKVQVIGGFLNTSSASPFPKESWNTLLSTGISSAFKPIQGISIQHIPLSAVTSASFSINVAVGRVKIISNGVNPVTIEYHWMGQDDGGNFLMLDGVEWYY